MLIVGVNIFASGIQLSFATCKIIRILESQILGFGIRNPAVNWNSEVPLTKNPESTAWNKESKTVLDFLTRGDIFHETPGEHVQ